jgi:hypothetical protein
MHLPSELSDRLTAEDESRLREMLRSVGDFMPRIYRDAVLDYQESRGDDANLFGLRVYKHLRHESAEYVHHHDGIGLDEPNGAYELIIGSLKIRLDVLGHFDHDDVMACFPDGSATKLAVGEINYKQLKLEMPEAELTPVTADYNLNNLTIGHFGNPRQGLVKWYLGAWRRTETGGRRWAWIKRQDEPGEGQLAEPLSPREPIVPFDQRSADAISVRPRAHG